MPGLTDSDIRGTPLWNHMVSVLSHVICEKPRSTLEALQPTSTFVLTGNNVPPKTCSLYSESRLLAKSNVPADALTNVSWASNYCTTIAPPKPHRKPLDGDEEEEELPPPEEEEEELPGFLNDIVTEQHAFNAVGTGLPSEESFRLVIGLKKLVRAEPLASARFWGKVTGSPGDYYIAETKIDPSRLPEEEEEELEDDEEEGQPIEGVAEVLFGYVARKHHSVAREEAGTGVNESVYYAAPSTDPTRWTRLPDVTPQQVCAARFIRNAFTGDLEAPVLSHPKFPGVEKNYLRAQIARITSNCRIAPRDIFTTEGAVPEEDEDEDGNPIPPPSVVPAYGAIPPLIPQEVPDEEDTETIQSVQSWFKGFPDDELLQGRFWVHIAPTLLKNGRVTVAPPPDVVEEEEGEPDEPIDRTEHINPFLSDLSKDCTLSFPGHSRASFPAWSFRRGFHNESSVNCTYVARSMLWPGAMTYAVTTRGKPGAEYQMLYMGDGLKNLQGIDYAPNFPPARLVEYPETGLVLQRDATMDEELDYAPLPTRPQEDEEEEEEEN